MEHGNYSNLRNVSSDPGYTFRLDIHLPFIILSVLIVSVNLFVILLFTYKRSLRNPSNYLLISLSVSDLFSGLVGIPLVLVCSSTPDCVSCIVSLAFIRFTSVSTVLHILAITHERYVKIVFPFKMPRIGTRSFELKVIAALWATTFIVSIIPWSWNPLTQEQCFAEERKFEKLMNKIYSVVLFTVFIAIPVLLLLYAYVSIFIVVRRQLDKIDETSVGQEDSRGRMKKESKVIAIFAMMMGYFIVCWSFHYASEIVESVGGEFSISDKLDLAITVLRCSTPLIDPLLYALLKHDFRRAIGLEIKRMKKKRHCTYGELAVHYTTGTATVCHSSTLHEKN